MGADTTGVPAPILSTGAAIGISVGTLVACLGMVAAWKARDRRVPKPHL
jgi:hypothetical protein